MKRKAIILCLVCFLECSVISIYLRNMIYWVSVIYGDVQPVLNFNNYWSNFIVFMNDGDYESFCIILSKDFVEIIENSY